VTTTAMPKVRIYPVCSECSAPYVLRHAFAVMNGGTETWAWFRDCKHKKAQPAWCEMPDPKRGRFGGRVEVPHHAR